MKERIFYNFKWTATAGLPDDLGKITFDTTSRLCMAFVNSSSGMLCDFVVRITFNTSAVVRNIHSSKPEKISTTVAGYTITIAMKDFKRGDKLNVDMCVDNWDDKTLKLALRNPSQKLVRSHFLTIKKDSAVKNCLKKLTGKIFTEFIKEMGKIVLTIIGTLLITILASWLGFKGLTAMLSGKEKDPITTPGEMQDDKKGDFVQGDSVNTSKNKN